MRVAIVYDGAADAGGTADVAGVLEAVDGVHAALVRGGHQAERVPLGAASARGLLPDLAASDLVFNLAEGLGGRAEDEPRVAALLALAGPPVTGASSDTLALCRRKDRVNALLAGLGLPVPTWALIGPGDRPAWDRFPAIVKPAGEDGSVGIDDRSVVDNAYELAAALARLPGQAIVQAFVGGRELNVGVVGDAVLPVAEIRFAERQRVVSYAAKWSAGSAADRDTRPECPARIPSRVRDEAVELARTAWRAVGGRGYGRVDLRTDDEGRPHVLEVNPNPDLAPSAGLARMARAAGWSYEGLVDRIIAEAGR